MAKKIDIGGELNSTALDKKLVDAAQVKDSSRGEKTLVETNEEIEVLQTESLRITKQSLSDREKEQARKNINAASTAEYTEAISDLNKQQDKFESDIRNVVKNYKPIVINGNVSNAADEEDITTDENNLLKLKDRNNLDGMGYVILRKNKTFAEQVTLANTIYEIRYDFDLGGEEVEIPENCVLKFNGGSLRNGTIAGRLNLKGDYINKVLLDVSNNSIINTSNYVITNTNYAASHINACRNGIIIAEDIVLYQTISLHTNISSYNHNEILFDVKEDTYNTGLLICSDNVTISNIAIIKKIYTKDDQHNRYAIRSLRPYSNITIDSCSIVGAISFSHYDMTEDEDYIGRNVKIINNTISADFSILPQEEYSSYGFIGFSGYEKIFISNNKITAINTKDVILCTALIIGEYEDYKFPCRYIYIENNIIEAESNIVGYGMTGIKWYFASGDIYIRKNKIRAIGLNRLFQNKTSQVEYKEPSYSIIEDNDIYTNSPLWYISNQPVNTFYFICNNNFSIFGGQGINIYTQGAYKIDIRNNNFFNVNNDDNTFLRFYFGNPYKCIDTDISFNYGCVRTWVLLDCEILRFDSNNTTGGVNIQTTAVKELNVVDFGNVRNVPLINIPITCTIDTLFISTDRESGIISGDHAIDSTFLTLKTNKPIVKTTNSYIALPIKGTTSQRPNNAPTGTMYYDTSIGKYIWKFGDNWLDVTNGYNVNFNKKGETSQRPKLSTNETSFQYFDTTLKKSIWWNGTSWVDGDGYLADAKRSGTSEERLGITTGLKVGLSFFDTTLGKNVWWSGSGWVDATGVDVDEV